MFDFRYTNLTENGSPTMDYSFAFWQVWVCEFASQIECNGTRGGCIAYMI